MVVTRISGGIVCVEKEQKHVFKFYTTLCEPILVGKYIRIGRKEVGSIIMVPEEQPDRHVKEFCPSAELGISH